jgi:hypothetical protein
MVKLSLIVLFAATLSTFALAASSLPLPPAVHGAAVVLVADASLR